MWEAIANVFLEWLPLRTNTALYHRISHAPVLFRHMSSPAASEPRQ
jgi:hypothetical protein